MISNWNEFYAAVKNLRRWQGLLDKGESNEFARARIKQIEKEIDMCIAAREAKTNTTSEEKANG